MGKGRVFTQKAVPGMNGITSGVLRDREYGVHIEIGRRPGTTQRVSFLRHLRRQRVGGVLRKDCRGANAKLGSRTRNTNGNFVTVSDERLAVTRLPPHGQGQHGLALRGLRL